jgi:hypothetical protein
MILAFLQAEIDSPRFDDSVDAALFAAGTDQSIVTTPDLQSEKENSLRRRVLGSYRGFGQNLALFLGFPQDVRWYKVLLDKDDLKKLRYAKYPIWERLSGGSRLVTDGAQNIDGVQAGENANTNIKGIAEALCQGKKYPPLILVSDKLEGVLTLIEGHARATAYLLEIDAIADGIEAIAGYSEAIKQWRFY